jgi:uncharacterized protein (TIGR00251 family)
MPILKPKTRLSLKVIPNADRNEIVSYVNGTFRIKLASPPEKGKANFELIRLLSTLLGISKDRICLIKGYANRNKHVVISGMNENSVCKLLLKE